MTNEEAIYELETNVDYKTPAIKEACQTAIKALEQQEKIGKWETTTTIFCGRTFEVIECSYCKQKQDWYAKTDFCPNCGARMVSE